MRNEIESQAGASAFRQRGQAFSKIIREYLGLLLALGALIAVFSFSTAHFFSLTTLRTITNQIPDAVLIAVGMTFVLILGGIDLSVGSVLALAGAVLGVCLVDFKWPLALALVACLLTGLLCGLVNGLVTVRWRLPSFIVTLGMLEIARGGAYLTTGSQTRYIGGAIERVAELSLLGVSLPFLLAVVVVLAGQFVLTRTVFGRYIVAIGTNEEAVRLAGIAPHPVKVAVFGLSGLLTGLAAVLHSARLSAADPNAGTGFELQAIAAAVIGGTSLAGGRGSVINSFFGVLLIAVLSAGLSQIGAQEPAKRLITGLVIVAAVIVDSYREHFRKAAG
ncbi:MAG: ABC transporter permease [Blastocatellia bacterium]